MTSLTDQIAAYLCEVKLAKTGEIEAHFAKKKYTHQQVSTAIKNCLLTGRIRRSCAGERGRKGIQTVWEGVRTQTNRSVKPPPPKKEPIPRVSFVFDLAMGETPIPAGWPGRRYEPLGAWDTA